MTDLIEYLIIKMSDLGSVAGVARALAELVERGVIRILDVVVVVRHTDGEVSVLEYEAVEGMMPLSQVEGEVGGMLSDHDIELASSALPPGTTGIVVVTDDQWAQPLSAAVRRGGGQIIGERILPSRARGIVEDPSKEYRGGV